MLGEISYLPSDPKLRAARFKYIEKTVRANNRLFEGQRKVVVLQNYTPEEMRIWDGWDQIIIKPVGAAAARNIVLRLFWETDEDFLWMLDDDVTFYDYYGFPKLVREFQNNEKLRFIDLGLFLEPRVLGFKSTADEVNVMTHIPLKKLPFFSYGVGAFLIGNHRKRGKVELEFTEDYKEQRIREDIEYILKNLIVGNMVEYMPLAVLKALTDESRSSQQWMFSGQGADSLSGNLAKKYRLSFRNGQISTKTFRSRIREQSKNVAVPRLYPLTKQDMENLKPRRYSKKHKKQVSIAEAGGLLRK